MDTAPDMKQRAAASRLLALLLFVACLAFLVIFADRDGYEGDDLNSILPMAHLAAAKQGLLLIYRYAWQPLSYEFGALVWRLFGTPTAVFLAAPIAGAITIALLGVIARREAKGPAPLLCALVAILAVPELFYSSLYFNSTILGMPLGAGALFLLRNRAGLSSAIAAGILTGLAVMMRLDFILICPLLAMAAWPRSETLRRPLVFTAAVIVVLGGAMATGFLDLPEIVRIQAMSAAEIVEKANVPGWDRRVKLLVALISLAPLGWLLLMAGAALAITNALRHRDIRTALWALAALLMLYPLLNILSPKYMLPLALFVVPFFARTLSDFIRLSGKHGRAFAMTALALALLPFLVSAAPQKQAPFMAISTMPNWPIGTHDGPRALGGYIWQMMATDAPENHTEVQHEADQIVVDWLNGPPGKTLFIGGENYFDAGGVGWRHAQLALEKRGIKGTLAGSHNLVFTEGDRRFVLSIAQPAEMPAGTHIIDRRSETHEP